MVPPAPGRGNRDDGHAGEWAGQDARAAARFDRPGGTITMKHWHDEALAPGHGRHGAPGAGAASR